MGIFCLGVKLSDTVELKEISESHSDKMSPTSVSSSHPIFKTQVILQVSYRCLFLKKYLYCWKYYWYLLFSSHWPLLPSLCPPQAFTALLSSALTPERHSGKQVLTGQTWQVWVAWLTKLTAGQDLSELKSVKRDTISKTMIGSEIKHNGSLRMAISGQVRPKSATCCRSKKFQTS